MLMKPSPGHSLGKRLLPLHIAVFLQGFGLWVPIEKLFLSEIGFDAASVGLMAAVYAAVVPIVEIPAGILADRWSRRGVLVLATIAMALSSLLGGLSTDVPTYLLSAMALGAYFALYSGTMDSIVYDTVLEETGNGEGFERRIGRVRLIESVALVTSALLGGWLASLTSTRLMYFLTVPFILLGVVAYLRFREPVLHKAAERTSLRHHLALTFRTLTRTRELVPVIALAVLTSLILTVLVEFGPLWLVALAVPAVVYGPYWAGLMSTLGLGGMLGGRLGLHKPVNLAAVAAVLVLATVVLTTSRDILVLIIAQIVLGLLVVAASIHAAQLLHDAVPSAIRTGVASGVSAVSWLTFLPFALVFGLVSNSSGVFSAAWMIVAAAVLASLLLARVTLRPRALAEAA